MPIILAKTAGFCAGVRRAVDFAYAHAGGAFCCYGPIINNRIVTEDLAARGVETISAPAEAAGRTVIIRSHGVGPEIYEELDALGIPYADLTCADVKRIHEIARDSAAMGMGVIITGRRDHPEVAGTNGWAGNSALIIGSRSEIDPGKFDKNRKYAVVSQTTFLKTEFEAIISLLKSLGLDIIVFDTICNSTAKRQEEAGELSAKADKMIVLGDKNSSNSARLYEICGKNCKNVYFVESIHDLQLNIFKKSDIIGLIAGASTPPAIIKEAMELMNEELELKDGQAVEETLENLTVEHQEEEQPVEEKKGERSFEEMLNENIVSLHTGDVVKGTVIGVLNGEVSVNLGYKSDGVILRPEFSDDPDLDPAEAVAPGDPIDVFVIRVNDADGNVTLSKKRIDSIKAMNEIEAAVESKAELQGKVIDIVKGGAIAIINGVRAFVPSSQMSNRFIDDLEAFKGKELGFNIIECDRHKRRVVAGRREIAARLIDEAKARALESIETGMIVDGTVSRITDFGAFVDLGGVDGLIHVSALSWARVRRVSDVLKAGDRVSAYVVNVDREKGKVSLSIKDLTGDPWADAEEKYPVGSVIEGRVARIVPFGAFIELEEGIDALVHVSQIAERRVQKPEDVLTAGEIVRALVTELNTETKRVSVSIKAYERLLAEEMREEAQEEIPSEPEACEVCECEAEEAPAEPEACEVCESCACEAEEAPAEAEACEACECEAGEAPAEPEAEAEVSDGFFERDAETPEAE